MPRAPRLVDVSVVLAPGLATYPGNPEFEITPVKRIANGDSSNNSRLVMGTHTGTHVDAPRHFFDDRPGVDSLALELLIGRARVIDLPHRGGITEVHLAAAGLREDLRILLRTPNSALWNSHDGFHTEYAYLTEGAAKFLVDQGVKVVGVDYLSVEQFHKPGAPAHHMLLGNGVIIIEGLNLSEADAGQYEMYCLPLRVAGADGAPARVVLKR
ncbi:MAG TPA: cyclase family protein [Vicinamibacterales bacterium]|nr:cyclase family protein [Vicinamibacterales bacterium]